MTVCDVEIIEEHRRCGEQPAWPFTGTCACRHHITGTACDPCITAVTPGCLTCWADGSGHICPVTFAPRPCRCGCGEDTPIATRTDARYGRRKGRPGRYISAHNDRGRRT